MSSYISSAMTHAELKEKKKAIVSVGDRVVALFYVNHEVYAMDFFCYHAGGPLALGDIEDFGGRACVICPWHKHKITLDTGESLYTAIDPANPMKKKEGCSKGVKQRTHAVKIIDGEIHVQLSDLSKEVDSDQYFTDAFKAMREATLKQPLLVQRPPGKNVPIHSFRPPPRTGR